MKCDGTNKTIRKPACSKLLTAHGQKRLNLTVYWPFCFRLLRYRALKNNPVIIKHQLVQKRVDLIYRYGT